MKRIVMVLAASAAVGGAAPAPAPQANYWMDVATASGMGAGMMGGGGQPNMAQVMQMMQGGGGQVMHSVNLYLSSKQKPAAPQASHMIPAGMRMGPSLPLIAPAAARPEPRSDGVPANFQPPKGKMLIYWGCGEHVGAGQPTVIDFASVAKGKMPAGYAAMVAAVRAAQPPRQGQSAGYGEWPNTRDSRPVPPAASLLGAHKIEANYAPPIAFTLAQGQDFMPGLGLREAGNMPSGAVRLAWTPAASATGYALSMFGATAAGDVVMWSSAAKAAAMPNMDYLTPAQARQLVASGAALAPGTSQCVLPAEVAKTSPSGMVMMIGYGPEANFSDKPKSPTWTTKVRYKTTASVMLGMGDMMGDAGPGQPQPQQPRRKRKFGLGDLIQGATGLPVGN
ncbi:hypothetical protein H8M03_08290 [Sphingomonas sabuli]|uniref:Uncharacterized protein n=1 Tax=Sphingomonas sabuli TaxID=2764186 RepID=A0A7G9L083_9SPHN|nr:hypothetical protein [Sphingomonas sabuli]QNM82032.1 hypothetical protein H8M03_08290 [Sphingomonas sabuli]